MTHKATRVIIWESLHNHKRGIKNANEKTIVEKSQILRLFVSVLSVLKIMGDTVLGMRKTSCFGNWVLKWRKELKFYRHGARKMSLFSL